jgi:hypothetical protein
LQLTCDILVSKICAFECNSYRYTEAPAAAALKKRAAAAAAASRLPVGTKVAAEVELVKPEYAAGGLYKLSHSA